MSIEPQETQSLATSRPAGKTRGQGAGRAVRGLLMLLGELLTGAGLVAVLAVAWLMWGQSPLPTVAQQHTNQVIQQALRAGHPLPVGVLALIRIPALGSSWQYPLYQGVSAAELSKGLGHYPSSAAAGAIGNFALAGHRSSDSGFEPMADLPSAIRVGDKILVDTADGDFTYTVTATEQTAPGDVRVLRPDQGRGADPADHLITITTCTPRFGSSGRFIVFGRLTGSVSLAPVAAASPAARAGAAATSPIGKK
ncbi:sortase [Streptacidiphilus sp. EB103A]|uniref:sortase n=1 Tax=Streptacidiphilus sp. EB103A TaxID=3156275 RepID=UPI003515E0AF